MPNFAESLPVLAPFLALAIGALAVLALDLLLPARQAYPWWFLVSAGSLVLAGLYLPGLWRAKLGAFGGALLADRLALAFTGIILVSALAALLLSLYRAEADLSGYLALLLWAAMGMSLLVSAGSLMTVFLGLELLSWPCTCW